MRWYIQALISLILSFGFAWSIAYFIGRLSDKKSERSYYLGVYQHCMDTEPQRYTIAITQDSHLPNIQDFSPICLEIAREYQRRNDYKLEHPRFQ